jgi:hypothetical protein
MLSTLRDIVLLIRIGRASSMESRGSPQRALNYLRSVKYSGSLEGFRRAYVARLMVLSRLHESLAYVREVLEFVTKSGTKLKYSSYCQAYCAYLECVLLNNRVDEARKDVMSRPASPLVKNTLVVT